jgi:hypothetical protein
MLTWIKPASVSRELRSSRLLLFEAFVPYFFESAKLTPEPMLPTSLVGVQCVCVRCLCFGASDVEPLSVRTIVRISLLAGVLLVLLTQSAEREGWLGAAYSGRQALLALMCAVLLQILTSWALAAPELALLVKECRSCGRRTIEN